jgi:ribosome-associated toxin RatA of RatAB toxin-antitoxin module
MQHINLSSAKLYKIVKKVEKYLEILPIKFQILEDDIIMI